MMVVSVSPSDLQISSFRDGVAVAVNANLGAQGKIDDISCSC